MSRRRQERSALMLGLCCLLSIAGPSVAGAGDCPYSDAAASTPPRPAPCSVQMLRPEASAGTAIIQEFERTLVSRAPEFTLQAVVKCQRAAQHYQVGVLRQVNHFRSTADYANSRIVREIAEPHPDYNADQAPWPSSFDDRVDVIPEDGVGPISYRLFDIDMPHLDSSVREWVTAAGDQLGEASLSHIAEEQSFTTWVVVMWPDGAVAPIGRVDWGYRYAFDVDAAKPTGQRAGEMKLSLLPTIVATGAAVASGPHRYDPRLFCLPSANRVDVARWERRAAK